MRFCISILTCLLIITNYNKTIAQELKPKLVVGIVIDQMRNDYISRYWNRFGEGGFKRLVKQGFYCKNTHYNYVPTFTGPGHASIYTGTTPQVHGIIANDWYDKDLAKEIYCVTDNQVKTIGSTSKAGEASPKNQLSTTLGDEMILNTNSKSKVIGIALKDRSSILPVGHAKGSAAYWFDDATGTFISSSWYMNELPTWIQKMNAKGLAKSYLEKGWNTLYPIHTYTASLKDDNSYEAIPNKKEKPIFPYEYSNYISKSIWTILKYSPWGNSITKDYAIECIKNESLGKDEFTDLLCLSFSSPDLIGHSYGIRSIEIEDVYLRLDKDIEELLNVLDAEVGKNNYTLFLTADHGAAEIPAYLKELNIPGGNIKESVLEFNLKSYCKEQYKDSLILNLSNQQIFLNEKMMSKLQLNTHEVIDKLIQKLLTYEGIGNAYPASALKYETYSSDNLKQLIANGYNQKRSGNIAFTYLPGWLDIGEKGTTHGAGFAYDTHVPLLFYGVGIKQGESQHPYSITEIIPTISAIIQCPFPNGCFSHPIVEVLTK